MLLLLPAALKSFAAGNFNNIGKFGAITTGAVALEHLTIKIPFGKIITGLIEITAEIATEKRRRPLNYILSMRFIMIHEVWIKDHAYLLVGFILGSGMLSYFLISGKISLSPVSMIFSKEDRPRDYWCGIFIYSIIVLVMFVGLFF